MELINRTDVKIARIRFAPIGIVPDTNPSSPVGVANHRKDVVNHRGLIRIGTKRLSSIKASLIAQSKAKFKSDLI